ncbi:putative peroxidase [Lupinus albus]|uniref:Peroxidase n=1 Tax=Lupinus albus TaxID=3870 RepID=A0A6A4QIQ2_LUPAL|nr:putative peroxidase [Lupinus albus]
MKMAGVFVTTILMFHLVVVPNCLAFLPRDWFNFIGFGSREGQKPQPLLKDDPGQPLVLLRDEQENPGTADPAMPTKAGLKEGFYKKSCPKAEKIVADMLVETFKTNPNAVSNVVRLLFHDCFVGGCDASLLLDFNPSGDPVEKSSGFNGLLLKGSDLIDDIKAKLEQECPETVSCADTIAFATNEALILGGLPRQRPLGGRRDALLSLASMVEDNNLPAPNWSLEKMIETFKKKGFNEEEMVILLGAHSIGSAHCDFFMDRAFNYKETNNPDPNLTPEVVDEIKKVCVDAYTPKFRNPPMNFDETPIVLDNLFFKNIVEKNKTLLVTDSYLLNDPRTAPTVQNMAADPNLFHKRFVEAMNKLNTLNVLTGNDGEVRKICRSTN